MRSGALKAPAVYWGKKIMHRLRMGFLYERRLTFESMLDSAGANRKCIDIMMNHVSKDTGNRVYHHKTLEELKTAIELLQRKPRKWPLNPELIAP